MLTIVYFIAYFKSYCRKTKVGTNYTMSMLQSGSVAEWSMVLVLGTSLRRQGFSSLHCQSLCAYRIKYLVLEIFNGPLRHLDLNENPYQMNRIIQRSVKTNLVKLIVDQNIPTSIINQSSDRSRIPNLKFLDPKSDVLKSGALFYYA